MKKPKTIVKKKAEQMTVAQRLSTPLPKFFIKIRMIGLSLTAVGGLLSQFDVGKVDGYILLAGALMIAIAQTAVKEGWWDVEE
jgi:hypothetical protein